MRQELRETPPFGDCWKAGYSRLEVEHRPVLMVSTLGFCPLLPPTTWYLPRLIEQVRSGVIHPEQFFTQKVPVTSAIEAYHHFDRHEDGWLKVKLEPAATATRAG